MLGPYRAVQRVGIARPYPAFVRFQKMPLQVAQPENIEPVVTAFLPQLDENAKQAGICQLRWPLHDLPPALLQLDPQKAIDLELPRRALDGFYLNGHSLARRIGRQQVKHGHVAGEGRRHIAQTAQFGGHQVLAYAKSMAGFANHSGGFLIFGVRNDPREVVGLKSNNFESQDDAKMAGYLNALISPALGFERRVVEVGGVKVGLLWTAPHPEPPVVALKSDGEVKEADVYYRYNARSEKIKFPEMRRMLDRVRDRERASWADMMSRIAKIGPESLGVMDIVKGEIHGRSGNLLIDAALVPKLNFIKEGSFTEGGEPTLKLFGDVTPVEINAAPLAVRLTSDPSAPAVRVEAINVNYPLDYSDIIREAKKRYSNFLANPKFHAALGKAKKNPALSRACYLHPERKKQSDHNSTRRYSNDIFIELDKLYTRR